MKKLQITLLIVYSIFVNRETNAQQWCSPGAKWTYENAYVIQHLFKFEYVGDTLINGYNSNIINKYSRIYFFGPPGSGPYAGQEEMIGSEYTLFRNDTLYHIRDGELKFLYDFGASAGDIWEVEVSFSLDTVYNCASQIITVDSVGIEEINGVPMRWVAYSSNTIDASGKAYERFGPINNFIFPQLTSCDLQEPPLMILRCYSDDEIGQVEGETSIWIQPEFRCDLYETVSIRQVTDQNEFQVYPNPASKSIIIRKTSSSRLNCIIINAIGQEVQRNELINNISTLDINLNSGLYYLKICDFENNIWSIQKLIIKNN